MRITKMHPKLPLVKRGKPLTISIDGQSFTAYAGETIATVLVANGRYASHYASRPDTALRPFCGIGICYGCVLLVNGRLARACTTTVIPGMKIRTRPEASR